MKATNFLSIAGILAVCTAYFDENNHHNPELIKTNYGKHLEGRALQNGAPTPYPTWSPTKSPTKSPTGTPTVMPVAPDTPPHFYTYTYQGCFNDRSDVHALPFAPMGTTSSSIRDCAESCRDHGFHFFGRQGAGVCRCGSESDYDAYGRASNCKCDEADIGSLRQCVYRVYAKGTRVYEGSTKLEGLSCAVPSGTANGDKVIYGACPTGAGNETWVYEKKRIVHSSRKCLHMYLDDSNANNTGVDLALWDCLDEDDPKYSNQLFSYEGICNDCSGSLRSGTGYEGTCNGYTGKCENGAVWNRFYIPEEYHADFESCEKIRIWDNAAHPGYYIIHPFKMPFPIQVYCNMDSLNEAGDFIDLPTSASSHSYSTDKDGSQAAYSRIKINFEEMAIDGSDSEFSSGSVVLPLGSVDHCSNSYPAYELGGYSTLNLTETIFEISSDVTWILEGTRNYATVMKKKGDNKVVQLSAGGSCGGIKAQTPEGDGLIAIDVAVQYRSCDELKEQIPTAFSGYYSFIPEGSSEMTSVYCDMVEPEPSPFDML